MGSSAAALGADSSGARTQAIKMANDRLMQKNNEERMIASAVGASQPLKIPHSYYRHRGEICTRV